MILDSVIAIKRLTKDADNSSKESFVDNLALQDVKCQIQPASAEETALVDGVFGQTFLMFTTESGVRVGDYVTVSGTGEHFRIKGLEDWSQIQGAPHFEATLVRFEEEEV